MQVRDEMYTKQRDELKGEVRRMLLNVSSNSNESKTEDNNMNTINLIDTLERLGVSYHFEKEIDEALDQMFHANSVFKQHYDLYTVALHFRVFRQHGYNISCGN